MTYIALLRGINVGRHRVEMTQLIAIFQSLGYDRIRSYLNSGNVFFDSESKDRHALEQEIEKALSNTLGYAVPVFLRTTVEIESLIHMSPFASLETTPDMRYCVVFVKQDFAKDLQFPIGSSKNDMELIGTTRTEAFVVWHIIDGRPPSGSFEKSVLPPTNTSRYYHTLIKIWNVACRS